MALGQRDTYRGLDLGNIDGAALTGGLHGGVKRRRIEPGDLNVFETQYTAAVQRADETKRTRAEPVGLQRQRQLSVGGIQARPQDRRGGGVSDFDLAMRRDSVGVAVERHGAANTPAGEAAIDGIE